MKKSKQKIMMVFGAVVIILMLIPSAIGVTTIPTNQSDEKIIEESTEIEQDPNPAGICGILVKCSARVPPGIINLVWARITCEDLDTGRIRYGRINFFGGKFLGITMGS